MSIARVARLSRCNEACIACPAVLCRLVRDPIGDRMFAEPSVATPNLLEHNIPPYIIVFFFQNGASVATPGAS